LCAAWSSMFCLCSVLLSSGLVASGRGLFASVPSTASTSALLDRRQLLQLPVAALPLAAALAAAPASAAVLAGYGAKLNIPDAIKVKIIKAKGLRATVRQSAQNRRSLPMDPTPGVNNYASLTDEVQRTKTIVLLPLIAALKELTKSEAAAELPEEQRKQLKEQPLLLKGHVLELDQALKELKFDEYKSKTTGAIYPGGKVERELEEVCETLDDFVALAAGQVVEERDGTQ